MPTMRFVKHKVAMDIVTGRAREPELVEHGGWQILRVTYAQLEDYQMCRRIMRQMSRLLKSSAHKRPDWDENISRLNKLVLERSA